MKLRKHNISTYRMTLTDSIFGQVKKIGNREWRGEIRDNLTGDIVRHAGIWYTRKDAVEEIVSLVKYVA